MGHDVPPAAISFHANTGAPNFTQPTAVTGNAALIRGIRGPSTRKEASDANRDPWPTYRSHPRAAGICRNEVQAPRAPLRPVQGKNR